MSWLESTVLSAAILALVGLSVKRLQTDKINSLAQNSFEMHHAIKVVFDGSTSSSLNPVSLIAPSPQYSTGSARLCLQPCTHDVQLNSKLDHCALILRAIITQRGELLPVLELRRQHVMLW